jgi:hypothetical protein
MKPIGWGMLVILIDLRYENVDLVVDLFGWLLLYFGLRRVWRLDNAFRLAAGFAFVGAVASLPELIPPYVAAEVFGGSARLGLLIIVGGAVIILTCTGLMRLADKAGDRSVENRVRWLRGVMAISVVLSLAVGPRQIIVSGGDTSDLTGLFALLVVALAFATTVYFVLLMFSRSVSALTTERSQAIT